MLVMRIGFAQAAWETEPLRPAVRQSPSEKGLTQEQMEELSGFSQPYISGPEQGKRNPTVVTLYELSQVLRRPIRSTC